MKKGAEILTNLNDEQDLDEDEQGLSDYMKDVNLMVLAISKDYLRLATDMQVLHRYLNELTKRIKRDEMESE